MCTPSSVYKSSHSLSSTPLAILGVVFLGSIILLPGKRGRVAKVRSISGHLAIQEDVGYLFHRYEEPRTTVDDGASSRVIKHRNCGKGALVWQAEYDAMDQLQLCDKPLRRRQPNEKEE